MEFNMKLLQILVITKMINLKLKSVSRETLLLFLKHSYENLFRIVSILVFVEELPIYNSTTI